MPDPVELGSADAAVEALEGAAEALRSSPLRSGCTVALPSTGRLLVTGDLHDNPEHFQKLVHLARLGESESHHLVLHEIIHSDVLVNGLDLSHRMLLRAAALVVRFPRQVHLLLANHELAQMTGSGVSKGGGDSVRCFNEGLAFVFGDRRHEVAGAVNRLIRAMPLAARRPGGLLCAHSLPAPGARFDPGVLDRELADEDYAGPPRAGSAYRMVWGRGWSEEQVEGLARRFGVELFCLGHEHVPAGIEVRGRRVVILNSDHEYGAALPVDLARIPSVEEAVLGAVRLRTVDLGELAGLRTAASEARRIPGD